MNHLSDEQLSVLLDDALSPSERAACDAHLAGCDACRERLAEASALDESLGKALTHDPGEAYFEKFADRVAKRIAAGAHGAAAASSRRGPWAWLTSPRGLALSGSTAALLVAAGLAWMRFHDEQDVARALREARLRTAAPLSAPPPASDELRSAPTAPAPAPPASAERARTDAATPRARMQEVRTLPNGEQVPVKEKPGVSARQEATGNALVAPATGSAIAQMKKRSIAPAAEAGATAEGAPAPAAMKTELSKDEEATPRPSQNVAPAPAAAPPAAARFAAEPSATHQKALGSDTSRGQSVSTWGAAKSLSGGSANELKADAPKLSGLAVTCGKVRDSRGRAVVGAEITAVRNGVRTSRTDAEGAFCVDGLATGDTLTVMHVGFDPWTVVMTPMTSLAITLEPVGTLGPNATMFTGKAQEPSPTFSGALHAHVNAPAETVRAAHDPYAGLSFGIRQLAGDARQATAVAQRERTAASYENAAKQWAALLGQVKGAPAHDASFHYVAALRAAYQLEPTSDRGRRLRSAISAFLATTPATLPERATVARWQAELDAAPAH